MLDFANEILRGPFALLAIPIRGSIKLRSRLRVKLNFSGASHGSARRPACDLSPRIRLDCSCLQLLHVQRSPAPIRVPLLHDSVLVKAGEQLTRECRTSFGGQFHGLFQQLGDLFRHTLLLRRTPLIR